MQLLKGMFLGAILTFVVSLVLGSNGSHGAYLNIHEMTVHTAKIWWSWPLFIASSGLSWGLIKLSS